MNTNHQYTNIAFISYKREDEAWAKWLQKKLEHYKLPTEIRKNNPNLEFSEHPRHVFKDTTDLSGGVLAEEIKKGLDTSKYLIVICSPRAAKSKWVCKEVQGFIESGREKYIIPFIIEGEPHANNIENECFPEALKALTAEKELLGINVNEYGREAAAVKVAARMFELSFDSLWQRFKREEKKKRRNIIAIFVIAIIILLSIIAYGIWANQRISEERDKANIANKHLLSANNRITRQKGELQEANDSILKQKSAIQQAFNNLAKTEHALKQSNNSLKEKNYQLKIERDHVLKANWKMLENQARVVSEKAKGKIAQGEIHDAVLALLEILPENKKDKQKPYVVEAEAALRLAIDSLMNNSWKKYALPSEREYFFTYNDKYILSEKQVDSVTINLGVFDTKLQEIHSIKLPSNYNYLACSIDDRYLAIGYLHNIRLYDLEKGVLKNNIYTEEPLFDSILENYNPIYLNSLLNIYDESDYSPNILTSFFMPYSKNVQVLNYLPQRNWILYKKEECLQNDTCDFACYYALLDIKSNRVLWNRTHKDYISMGYNDVRLSHNGNFIIISQRGSIQIINTSNNKTRTLLTEDDSDHYSNHASMTKDEKFIFQNCEFSNSGHIYDVETLSCIDSLDNYPMLPSSLFFTLSGKKYIINSYNYIDITHSSYLYFFTNYKHLDIENISNKLVRRNINNRVYIKHKKDLQYSLCYNDKFGHIWECENANFIGFTPDFQYIAVKKEGFRGIIEYQILDVNSGICMYKESPDDFDNETFNFLLYNDLLKISKDFVKGMKLKESSRKDFFLM